MRAGRGCPRLPALERIQRPAESPRRFEKAKTRMPRCIGDAAKEPPSIRAIWILINGCGTIFYVSGCGVGGRLYSSSNLFMWPQGPLGPQKIARVTVSADSFFGQSRFGHPCIPACAVNPTPVSTSKDVRCGSPGALHPHLISQLERAAACPRSGSSGWPCPFDVVGQGRRPHRHRRSGSRFIKCPTTATHQTTANSTPSGSTTGPALSLSKTRIIFSGKRDAGRQFEVETGIGSSSAALSPGSSW